MASEEVAFNRAFGGRVSRRRKQLGMSQATLAGLVGLDGISITNIEAGRQNVVAYTVRLLARYLKTSADELLDTSTPPAAVAEVFPDIKRPD